MSKKNTTNPIETTTSNKDNDASSKVTLDPNGELSLGVEVNFNDTISAEGEVSYQQNSDGSDDTSIHINLNAGVASIGAEHTQTTDSDGNTVSSSNKVNVDGGLVHGGYESSQQTESNGGHTESTNTTLGVGKEFKGKNTETGISLDGSYGNSETYDSDGNLTSTSNTVEARLSGSINGDSISIGCENKISSEKNTQNNGEHTSETTCDTEINGTTYTLYENAETVVNEPVRLKPITVEAEAIDPEQENWDEHADVVLDDMENQEFIDESLADIEQETTQEAYDQAWEEEADLRLDQIEDEFKSLDKESVVPPIQNTLATQASSAGFKQWFNLTVQEDWNDEQWEKQLIGSTIDTTASGIQELIISDGASFEKLSSTFQGNLQSSGSSLVAGYIVNDALGIEFGSDLGGQVMSTVVSHTSSSAVQAAYTAATSTTSFSDAFVGAFSSSSSTTTSLTITSTSSSTSSLASGTGTGSVSSLSTLSTLGNAVGGVVGAYAAQQVLHSNTEAEVIGSAVGATVGSILGSVFLCWLGPVGTMIGSYLGSALGDTIGENWNEWTDMSPAEKLFDFVNPVNIIETSIDFTKAVFGMDEKEPEPEAGVTLVYNPYLGVYEIESSYGRNGGDANALKGTANNLGDSVQDLIAKIAGDGQLANRHEMPKIEIGYEGEDQFIRVDGQYVGELNSQGMQNAMGTVLKDAVIEGGDLYVNRMIHSDKVASSEILNLIQSAQKTQTYDENPALKTEVDSLLNEKNDELASYHQKTAERDALDSQISQLSDKIRRGLRSERFDSDSDYTEKPTDFDGDPTGEPSEYEIDLAKLNELKAERADLQSEIDALIDFDQISILEKQVNAHLAKLSAETDDTNVLQTKILADPVLAKYQQQLDDVGADLQTALEWQAYLNATQDLNLDEAHNFDDATRLEYEILHHNTLYGAEPENQFSLYETDLSDLVFEQKNGELTIYNRRGLDADTPLEEVPSIVITDWENWSATDSSLKLSFTNHDTDETIELMPSMHQLMLQVNGFSQSLNGETPDTELTAENMTDTDMTVNMAKTVAETYNASGKAFSEQDALDLQFSGFGSQDGETLSGLNGDDILLLNEGITGVKAGSGDDLIVQSDTATHTDGGNGSDTVSYILSDAGVSVDLTQNQGEGGFAEGDTYENVENAIGSNYNDTLTGNEQNNELSGLDGDDKLEGGQGDDTLLGGAGNDWLDGGQGHDHIDGGEGSDTVTYADTETDENGSHIVLSHENTQGDAVDGFATLTETDTLSDIENIVATDTDDKVIGNASSNSVLGQAGDDQLSGLDGDDALFGGTGDDILDGGEGHDLLVGGSGNDTLVGGAGDDLFKAGEGQDALLGGDGNDAVILTGSMNDYQYLHSQEETVYLANAEGEMIRIESVEQIGFQQDESTEIHWTTVDELKAFSEADTNRDVADRKSIDEFDYSQTASNHPTAERKNIDEFTTEPTTQNPETTQRVSIDEFDIAQTSTFQIDRKSTEELAYSQVASNHTTAERKNIDEFTTEPTTQNPETTQRVSIGEFDIAQTSTPQPTINRKTPDVFATETPSQPSVVSPQRKDADAFDISEEASIQNTERKSYEDFEKLIRLNQKLDEEERREQEDGGGVRGGNFAFNSGIFASSMVAALSAQAQQLKDSHNISLEQSEDLKHNSEASDTIETSDQTTLNETSPLSAQTSNLILEENADEIQTYDSVLAHSYSQESSSNDVITEEDNPDTGFFSPEEIQTESSPLPFQSEAQAQTTSNVDTASPETEDITETVTFEEPDSNITSQTNDSFLTPLIATQNIYTLEDTEVALNIQVTGQNPNRESLEIFIKGVPESASLSSGTLLPDGRYRLSPEELTNLAYLPSNNSDENYLLEIEVISTELGTGIKRYQTTTQLIEIEPVPDEYQPKLSDKAPEENITLGGIVESEGWYGATQGADYITTTSANDTIHSDYYRNVPLDISVILEDIDGSEELVMLQLANLPKNTVVIYGAQQPINIDENGYLNAVHILNKLPISLMVPYDTGAFSVDLNSTVREINNDSVRHKTATLNLETDATKGGDDVIDAGDGNNTIYAAAGNDTITTGTGHDTINAGDGDNTIVSGLGNDQIRTGDGIDTITTDNGDKTIYAGAGDDVVTTQDGTDYIDAGEGHNRVTTGDGDKTIFADGGDDQITTGSGNDAINAGGGENVILAGDGENTITTLDGDDRITTGQDNDVINAGAGINIVDAGEGDNEVTSGAGNDEIVSGDGHDLIQAGDGADTIDAGNGNNTVYAEGGNDTITTGSGIDFIYGGLGNDIIHSGDGSDVIAGGSGVNRLYAGAGNDVLVTNGSDAVLDGGSGADTVKLNGTANTYNLTTLNDIEFIEVNTSATTLQVLGNFNIETLIGHAAGSANKLKIQNTSPSETTLFLNMNLKDFLVQMKQNSAYYNLIKNDSGNDTLVFDGKHYELDGYDQLQFNTAFQGTDTLFLDERNNNPFILETDTALSGNFYEDGTIGYQNYTTSNAINLSSAIKANTYDIEDGTNISIHNFTGNHLTTNYGNGIFYAEQQYHGRVDFSYTIKDSSGATSITTQNHINLLEVDDTPVVEVTTEEFKRKYTYGFGGDTHYTMYNFNIIDPDSAWEDIRIDVDIAGGGAQKIIYNFDTNKEYVGGLIGYDEFDDEFNYNHQQYWITATDQSGYSGQGEGVLDFIRYNGVVEEYYNNMFDSYMTRRIGLKVYSSGTALHFLDAYSLPESRINDVDDWLSTSIARSLYDFSFNYSFNGEFQFGVKNHHYKGTTDTVTPIFLDLDNDGFDLSSSVNFDFNSGGELENGNWTADAQDAILVYDWNQDNLVNNASEIAFSEYHPEAETDLEGLALAFDSNQDGLFNALDEKWQYFGVWQDANLNGITDSGEFLTMEQSGISEIELTSDNEVINGDGFTIFGQGNFTYTDGTQGNFADVALEYEQTASETQEVTAEDNEESEIDQQWSQLVDQLAASSLSDNEETSLPVEEMDVHEPVHEEIPA